MYNKEEMIETILNECNINTLQMMTKQYEFQIKIYNDPRDVAILERYYEAIESKKLELELNEI